MSKIQKLRDGLIKFQNLEEHARQISRSMRSEEQLQNDYLELIAAQERKLNDLDKEFVLIDKERKDLALSREKLVNRESAISVKEADFLLVKTATELELARKERESIDLASNAKSEASKYAAILQETKKAILVAQDELNSMQSRLEASKAIMEQELAQLKSLVILEKKDYETYKSITNSAKKELKRIEDEITVKQEENIKEGEKAAQVINSLLEREQKITKRENNFLILKLRLDKVLNKLYPGQNIDNLI